MPIPLVGRESLRQTRSSDFPTAGSALLCVLAPTCLATGASVDPQVLLSMGGRAPFRLAGERDRAINLGLGPPQLLLGLVASWCLAQRCPVTPGW